MCLCFGLVFNIMLIMLFVSHPLLVLTLYSHALWITQHALAPQQPGGLLSLPSCLEEEAGKGGQKGDYKCMCACGRNCVQDQKT